MILVAACIIFLAGGVLVFVLQEIHGSDDRGRNTGPTFSDGSRDRAVHNRVDPRAHRKNASKARVWPHA